MATISDIAKHAGVSKATVSRVLNGHKHVSKKLQTKVKQVADDLGYIPNGNAISLSTGKTQTLGVLLPASDHCYDELVDSILLNAKKRNYRVMVLPSYYEKDAEESYYEILRRKIVDGLIITSVNTPGKMITKLQKYGKIASAEKLDQDITMIYPDRMQMYKKLFATLKEKQKQKVAFTVERTQDLSKSTQNKIKAYETSFKEPKLNKDYFVGLTNFSDGYKWAKKMAKANKHFDVIYTSGDQIASGMIKGFAEEKLYHGKDYQLVSEGNTPYSKVLDFSSIDFCYQEIGQALVAYMLSDKEKEIMTFQPKIMWRNELNA